MPTKKHKGKFTRRHPPTSSRKAKKDKKKKGVKKGRHYSKLGQEDEPHYGYLNDLQHATHYYDREYDARPEQLTWPDHVQELEWPESSEPFAHIYDAHDQYSNGILDYDAYTGHDE